MPRDKTESHKRVLAAAREEFMEYGFENASMRRIGERCGMTAAGLYRHCKDKAGLFEELVTPSIDKINEWLHGHVSRSIANMRANIVDLNQDSDIDMMRDLIYPNMEEYRLLLTKAQGTPYANYLHDLTKQQEEMMLSYIPMLRENGYASREIDSKELHILLSAYTAALLEPVIDGYTTEEALRCLDTLEEFFIAAWQKILGL